MDLGLGGRVALVLAASKGLGRATAASLAAEGADVVIGARNEHTLGGAAAAIRAETGGRVLAVPVDVTDAAQSKAFVDAALREFGQAYGVAFQMQDDLLDMTADAAAIGKPVGGDLREKKMTIPVILALVGSDREFRADVERFYAEDDETPERIAGIVHGIGVHGGFEQTRAVIVTYLERAKASLVPLGNAAARAEFVAIADALLKG